MIGFDKVSKPQFHFLLISSCFLIIILIWKLKLKIENCKFKFFFYDLQIKEFFANKMLNARTKYQLKLTLHMFYKQNTIGMNPISIKALCHRIYKFI